MYTAKIVSYRNTVSNGNLRRVVKVKFLKDGVDNVTLDFDVALYTPPDQIKQLIRDRVEELQKGDTYEVALPVDVDVDLTGTYEILPPEAIAKRDFRTSLMQLEILQKAVDLGAIPATHKMVTDLQAEVALKTKIEVL